MKLDLEKLGVLQHIYSETVLCDKGKHQCP